MGDSSKIIAEQIASSQTSGSSGCLFGLSLEFIAILALIIVNLATIIFHIFMIYKSWKDIQNQQKLFIESQNLKERDDIRHRLNHFFGPMKALRSESRLLFDVFAIDEKKEAATNNSYFRTLTFLTDGKSFNKGDEQLLSLIVDVGKKQLKLIEKEGWAVENSALTELLGFLGAHIRTLILAKDHKLDEMTDKLKRMVFPLEIDGALESETRKLRDRYRELLNKYQSKKMYRPDFSESETISYYQSNPQKYFKETAYLNLSDIYKEFTEVISRGAMILDAGCGVGRDTRYFIKHGYKVISFDASSEMVEMCQQYPFAYCLEMSFEDVEYLEEFDAVWANASLIHTSKDKFPNVFLRLINALREDGIIYFSLKRGSGSTIDKGRRFYYYTEEEVDKIISESFSLEKIKIWINKGLKKSDSTDWMNFMYRKPKIVRKVKGYTR